MDNRTELRAVCLNKDTTLFVAPDGAVWSSLRVKLNSDSTYRIEHNAAGSTVNPEGVMFTPHELSALPNLKTAQKILKKMSQVPSTSRARSSWGWGALAATVVVICVGGGALHLSHTNNVAMKNMAMMMASQGGSNDGMGMGMGASPDMSITPPQAQAPNANHAPVHVFQPVKNNGAFFRPKTPIALPAPAKPVATSPANATPAPAPVTPVHTSTPPQSTETPSDSEAAKNEKISQMQDKLDDLKQIPDVLPGSDYSSWKELRQVMPEKTAPTKPSTAGN